jgi:hypothetical protein
MSFIKKPEVDVMTAVVALVEAQARVEEAGKKRDEALQDYSNAVSNCNKIQSDFDTLVNHLHTNAPIGTYWENQY